jgi:hypothetical protein
MKIIQSYVWHRPNDSIEKIFFISMIERESSAVHAYGAKYFEIAIWEVDEEFKKLEPMLFCEGGNLKDYFNLCVQFSKYGEIKE